MNWKWREKCVLLLYLAHAHGKRVKYLGMIDANRSKDAKRDLLLDTIDEILDRQLIISSSLTTLLLRLYCFVSKTNEILGWTFFIFSCPVNVAHLNGKESKIYSFFVINKKLMEICIWIWYDRYSLLMTLTTDYNFH